MAKRKRTPDRRPSSPESQRADGQHTRRRKRRAGKRTLHYLLLLIFVLGTGVALSLTVFFKIDDIQVIGVDKYEPDDIIEASGIQIEDNLLKIPVEEAQNRILAQFPYIESVRIARRFPPRVEIQVTQSVPGGALMDNGQLALITREGKLLETGDPYIPAELPIIKGISFAGFSPGEMLGAEENPENLERLRMLDYLFDAAANVGFGPITNVDVTDRLNMKIVYEARLILELGSEADMEYKLTFLREVIKDLGPDDQARLDATNARSKRVLVKWGKVENGVFTPLTGSELEAAMGGQEKDISTDTVANDG